MDNLKSHTILKKWNPTNAWETLHQAGTTKVKMVNHVEKAWQSSVGDIHLRSNGGYSKGDPPLTIPNREVKPLHADGTAARWESRSPPIFTTKAL
jgi:hypothetical protein